LPEPNRRLFSLRADPFYLPPADSMKNPGGTARIKIPKPKSAAQTTRKTEYLMGCAVKPDHIVSPRSKSLSTVLGRRDGWWYPLGVQFGQVLEDI
jgi:hypothetical protein